MVSICPGNSQATFNPCIHRADLGNMGWGAKGSGETLGFEALCGLERCLRLVSAGGAQE